MANDLQNDWEYIMKDTNCRNPTLAKCGGEAQHLGKLEV